LAPSRRDAASAFTRVFDALWRRAKQSGSEVLGAIFSILSAASFALNNATMRRGVVSGTPEQAMALSVPLGVLCFLPFAAFTGELLRIGEFPAKAAGWMAGLGVLHFIIGRYFNFKANAVAGVNLTAPVVQLQVVVTMFLAVLILHEPCSALQIIGGVVMLAGSLITQRQPLKTAAATPAAQRHAAERGLPPFIPLYLAGYIFASFAAIAYGSSPIMARFALEHTGPSTGILGGLIAYVAATAVGALAFLSPALRKNVSTLQPENARWFACSGVLVAAAQGFFFCAVALAPVLFVMPLLQTSLAFRLIFSTWLSPNHEVFGKLVVAGAAISILGALLVSIDSASIVHALALPDPIANALLWHV
jgi:drug/metabolite transporter (DMT)-like permease